MKSLTNSNVIPLYDHVTKALLPLAESNQVKLNFFTFTYQFIILHDPRYLISDFAELLSNIIVHTPQGCKLDIFVKRATEKDTVLQVEILSTGANLSCLTEITSALKGRFKISTPLTNTTKFELFIETQQIKSQQTSKASNVHNYGIPPYFAKIKKRLKSHFSSIETIEKKAIKKSQAHGVFIQKVNAVIQNHLEEESFKVEMICHELALSRTQLYRKLKKLINMSPAKYILYFRLQKAKELLQNTNLNVGEVSVRTGFSSHSHFSRTFVLQFGMSPSQMKNENIVEN